MLELDVINDCLGSLGESPVNSIDEGHPFIPTAQRILVQENLRLQSRSWWFNQEWITLTPDTRGEIYVPGDTISCVPQSTDGTPYVQRGRRLYDVSRSTYDIGKELLCRLVRNIPFEDLPATAQHVVAIRAVKKFQQSFDADRFKAQEITQDFREAWVELVREHTRAIQANMLARPSYTTVVNRIFNGANPAPFPSVSGNWS